MRYIRGELHVRVRGNRMPSSIGVGRILGIRVDIHFSLFLIVAFSQLEPRNGVSPRPLSELEHGNVLGDGVCVRPVAVRLGVAARVCTFAGGDTPRVQGRGQTLFLLGGVSSIASESRLGARRFRHLGRGTTVESCHCGGPRACRRIERRVVAGLRGARVRRDHQSAVGIVQPAARVSAGRRAGASSGHMGRDGSFHRASGIATRSGQVVGLLLVAFGVFQVIQGHALQGIWRCSWDGS